METSWGVLVKFSYILIAKKEIKAIKFPKLGKLGTLFSRFGKEKKLKQVPEKAEKAFLLVRGNKERKSNQDQKKKCFFERLQGKEKVFLDFIKRNKTECLLRFFRQKSALIVVVFASAIVSVGNASSTKGEAGFLYGYFKKPASNEEKLIQRVKSNAYESGNLSTIALINNEIVIEGEGDISEMISGSELEQNQMQFQVMTATTSPDAKKLLEEGSDVAVYEVQNGDTVSTIAKEFNVTVNTILWANDIDDPDMIMPGDKIFILPVTGIKHVVKKDDTIDKIAKKYEADKNKIIAFNELPADGRIEEGEELIIPDGKIEQPTTAPNNLLQRRNYYSSEVIGGGERGPSIIDRNPKGGHVFPYGYCTWYVAQHKYVPWGGNAGTWLYHARAYGAKTGKTPKEGAIIVTSESWYGHVGIVTKVKGNQVTIKEMNYKGFGIVSSRTISAKSSVIKGYIY